MKLLMLLPVAVVLLSVPALAQKRKPAPKKVAAPVVAEVVSTELVVPVKKRTPMMNEEGSGTVYEFAKEVAYGKRNLRKGTESAHQTEGQQAQARKSGKSSGRSVVERPVVRTPRVDRPQVVAPSVHRPQMVVPRVNRPRGG